MTIVDDVPRDLVLRVHMQHPTYLLGQIRLAVFARVEQFMKTIDDLNDGFLLGIFLNQSSILYLDFSGESYTY